MELASDELVHLGGVARNASHDLARRTGDERRRGLGAMAATIRVHQAKILAANRLDRRDTTGTSKAQLDRLTLDARRIEAMASGLEDVARLPDILGQVESGWTLGNGVKVRRVRVPLGVIGVIYENRPNVTADAAGLALYSGNAVLLRGSSQSLRTNMAVVAALREGLAEVGLPEDAVGLVHHVTHESAVSFMKLDRFIDCLIPRGGPMLIAAVRDNATVPTVIDGAGNCHIYLDASAKLADAVGIVANAKTQRPGVCNAVETVLVHRDRVLDLLPALDSALPGVEIRGDSATCAIIGRARPVTEEDYAEEFLDLILAVRVVDSLEEAIDHIGTYGTGHSEAIITQDIACANTFVERVDAAAVLVNASTRFVDGSQLGMGAEIGISTQKLHARGPMGLSALTTTKLVIEGNGQIRH